MKVALIKPEINNISTHNLKSLNYRLIDMRSADPRGRGETIPQVLGVDDSSSSDI